MLTLTAPDGAKEIRRVPIDWARVDQDHDVDLEVVADEAHSTARIACSQASWLEVSDDAGGSWHALGTDVQSGYELGPLTEGQRLAITLRLHIPPATSVRTKAIELYLGMGT